MIWINGELTSKIAAADRGLLYGDGFFTTLKVTDGAVQLWSFHAQRLARAASTLAIPLPSVEKLRRFIEDRTEAGETCAFRITVTRGVGGRGYAPAKAQESSVIVQKFAIPADYAEKREHGIRVLTSSHLLGSEMRLLKGLKTLNRLEQVILKQELAAYEGVDDLLVRDEEYNVVELTAGNIFWRSGNVWFTAALSKAGIEGVVRAFILSERPDIQCVEASLAEVEQADELLVTNALLEVAPIRKLNNKYFEPTIMRSLATLKDW
ncbi:MAG: 4-amino-4-deoxychorismate lyase PabC [Idiomarinaceae bacterium HL-53]|nr:MAG: 4-amino-4-deoxychorismate lyase PabC [Idiomarinaceae bacterium HL-53]CUS48947.1 4-amino-4-deoxychorismate lyase [Idiomarinaceae bacterium HL-53]